MATRTLDDRRRARAAFLWACAFFGLAQLVGLAMLQIAPRPERIKLDGPGAAKIPDVCESTLQWQCHYLLTTNDREELLFIGDSSCLMGVMPAVVGDKTHLRTRNLGTLGYLGADGHADMLQLFVERHGVPKVCVYCVAPFTFTVSNQDIERVGCLKRFRAFAFGDAKVMTVKNPRTLVPTCRLGQCLGAFAEECCISADYLEMPRGPFPSDQDTRVLLEASKGYLADPTGPCRKLASPVPYDAHLHRDCVPGLVRMFETAERHKFRLVVLMNPVSDNHRTAETETAMQQTHARLQELAGPYAQVRIATPFLRYAPAESFASPNHLTPAGAAANSEVIGAMLAESYLPQSVPGELAASPLTSQSSRERK